MNADDPDNEEIAQVLDRIAELLDVRDDNPYRVQAYNRGAETARHTKASLTELAQAHDIDAINALPHIGQGMASTVMEHVNTGRSSLLDRLEGEVTPVDLFQQLPGIGPELPAVLPIGWISTPWPNWSKLPTTTVWKPWQVLAPAGPRLFGTRWPGV